MDKPEPGYFGGQLDPSKVRFPEGLVVFQSELANASLLLNPELGTFTKVSLANIQELRKLQRKVECTDLDVETLRPILAKLIVERVVYYDNYLPLINEASPAVPAAVYWETTHGCSLRCVYCYMNADTVRPGELTTIEAKRLIEQVSELGSARFIFTGGEPLIRKDIFDLGLYARSQGLSTEIITNATLVTSVEVAQRIKQSFNHVVVSLDGACSEHNDIHRGQGSFALIIRGMRFLNLAGVRLVVNSVVSEANVDRITELYKLLDAEFDVLEHRVMSIGHIGRGRDYKNNNGRWQVYHRLFEQSKERLRARSNCSAGTMRRETLSKADFIPRKNCGMGSGEIYVNSQGQVYPCKLVTTPEWFAGSLREAPLQEILRRQAIRRARDHSVMDTPGCRSCIIRRLCGGGCRGFHLGHSGDAFTNDPNLCWTLRHGMITNMWLAEGESTAIDEDAAYVPYVFASAELWQPELGTALPEHMLHAVTRHLETLQELPLI